MKPWLEEWQSRDGWLVAYRNPAVSIAPVCGYEAPDREDSTLALMAAAPDMCRALLAVEWKGPPSPNDWMSECPYCRGRRRPKKLDLFGHQDKCALDAALTKAGLPDQASRDAARKELGL